MDETREEFFNACSEMYSKKEIELFETAIDFIKQKFGSEKRISGEEQVVNNIRIGLVLVKSKLTSEIVCAGLLYGLDERLAPKEIQDNFGKGISDLVFGQNQLRVLREKNRNAEAEIVRKILLTSLYAPRVIFVKLASKLTSLLTLGALPELEQKRITKEVLEQLPSLKAICTISTGFDHIDIKECEKRNIKVLNVPHYGENTVAEHTFALILALSRRLIDSVERARKGDFTLDGLRGFDLKDKLLGIIGMGHIGIHVARIAKGFEMKVLAFDPKEDKKIAKKIGFEYSNLENLLA